MILLIAIITFLLGMYIGGKEGELLGYERRRVEELEKENEHLRSNR